MRYSSGPQLGPAGPRLEKLLMEKGGVGMVEPTLKTL
jgi:hypothetical protein